MIKGNVKMCNKQKEMKFIALFCLHTFIRNENLYNFGTRFDQIPTKINVIREKHGIPIDDLFRVSNNITTIQNVLKRKQFSSTCTVKKTL